MNAKELLIVLREIKDVSFSSVDKNTNPKCRIIDVMLVEDEKLYFLTARGKDFYKELMANNKVAVTALTENFESIRLEGKANKVGDNKYYLDKIFECNPVMNEVYPGDSRDILDVFCIDKGIIEYFDLSKHPIYRETFSFGGEKIKDKGYFINETCINCKKCFNLCPQSAIYELNGIMNIKNENCLHCGLCYENCPVKAVERW
ncbi:4Fe-4S binding protein [uncultured Anaerofustis sp.]|uniref:4Fe-4S binding protein n=1 Tax=uncultured Anaerofustis sp. TaxID=904996 RepID=UPI0025D1D55B|nr:4Fe-4S binding protein [uncultured Anaerofustis sp.]